MTLKDLNFQMTTCTFIFSVKRRFY